MVTENNTAAPWPFILGGLEFEVMAAIWRAPSTPQNVKEIASRLSRERVYNTVQSTVDRLYRKRLLEREKQGPSYVYTARVTRAGYHRQLVAFIVGKLLPSEREAVLEAFVDTAAEADLANLERLTQLIEAKRTKL